jgi:hypothetical protein
MKVLLPFVKIYLCKTELPAISVMKKSIAVHNIKESMSCQFTNNTAIC